jgi:hypothetical protein
MYKKFRPPKLRAGLLATCALAIGPSQTNLTDMKPRFHVTLAMVLAALTFQAAAQSRPPPAAQYDDRVVRELSRPKYQSNPFSDRAIRDENDALRNRLLLPRERQPLGRHGRSQ